MQVFSEVFFLPMPPASTVARPVGPSSRRALRPVRSRCNDHHHRPPSRLGERCLWHGPVGPGAVWL